MTLHHARKYINAIVYRILIGEYAKLSISISSIILATLRSYSVNIIIARQTRLCIWYVIIFFENHELIILKLSAQNFAHLHIFAIIFCLDLVPPYKCVAMHTVYKTMNKFSSIPV